MRVWDPRGWNTKLGARLRYPDYDGIDGHQTIRLSHQRRDHYQLEMMHSGPLGRPGMRVSLDTAAGRRYRLKLDDQGRVPSGTRVIAQPGEEMVLRGPKGVAAIHFHAPTEGEWWSAESLAGDTWTAVRQACLELGGYQGGIGDCWALGPVLAIAATCPEALSEIFGGQGGRVGVRLFDYDAKTETYSPVSYLVDDRFSPLGLTTDRSRARAENATHLPQMPTHADPHLWLRILEKALASRRGSHPGLSVGWPRESFEALLGAPAETLSLDTLTLDAITARLLEARDARQPVALGSGARLFPKLMNAHIYAVRSIEVDRQGQITLELHNPHGRRHARLRGSEIKTWASQLWIGTRPSPTVP